MALTKKQLYALYNVDEEETAKKEKLRKLLEGSLRDPSLEIPEETKPRSVSAGGIGSTELSASEKTDLRENLMQAADATRNAQSGNAASAAIQGIGKYITDKPQKEKTETNVDAVAAGQNKTIPTASSVNARPVLPNVNENVKDKWASPVVGAVPSSGMSGLPISTAAKRDNIMSGAAQLPVTPEVKQKSSLSYIQKRGQETFADAMAAIDRTEKAAVPAVKAFFESLLSESQVQYNPVEDTQKKIAQALRSGNKEDARNIEIKPAVEFGANAVAAGKKAFDASLEQQYEKDSETRELLGKDTDYADTDPAYEKARSNPAVKVAGDLNATTAYMLPAVMMSYATGNPSSLVSSALSAGTIASQAYPMAFDEAKAEGATTEQAGEYALREAGNQALGDMVIGGAAGVGSGILDYTVGRYAGTALNRFFGSKPMLKAVSKVASEAIGEGAEEVIQSLVTTANQRATYNPEAEIDPAGIAYEGVLGALMGAAYNVPSIPGKYSVYRADYDTVNFMSKAAASVKTEEDVRQVEQTVDMVSSVCEENIDTLKAEKQTEEVKESIARLEYIRDGMSDVKEELETHKEEILARNEGADTETTDAQTVETEQNVPEVQNDGEVLQETGSTETVTEVTEETASEGDTDFDTVYDDSPVAKALRTAETDVYTAGNALLSHYGSAKAAVDALYQEGRRLSAEGNSEAVKRVEEIRDNILQTGAKRVELHTAELENTLKKYGIRGVVVDTSIKDSKQNGFYDPSTKTIHISPMLSSEEAIIRAVFHELTHSAAAADIAIVDDIMNVVGKLEKDGIVPAGRFSRERYLASYAKYAAKHAGSKPGQAELKAHMDSGMTREEAVQRIVDDYVKQEMAADLFGEVVQDPTLLDRIKGKDRTLWQRIVEELRMLWNRLTGKQNLTPAEQRLVDAVRRVLSDVSGETVTSPKVIQNKTGKNVAYDNGDTLGGDDVRFSLIGMTDEGNEVYQTSDEIMNLSVSERIAKFKKDFVAEFRGRTAKFERNGHTHYAQFSDIGKLTYEGKSKSSDSGYKAKIRVLAEGNVFELVEDSAYAKTEPETGKKTESHKNAKYWDYFVKTIVVDGKAYDVVINVREDVPGGDFRKKERFVYSVMFQDNKKAATSVSSPATSKVPSKIDVTANNSIADSSDVVKGDVRYSKEMDTEYMAAVESGDMDTAQRMVDEAAKAAGYTYRRNTRNVLSPMNSVDTHYMFVESDGSELSGYGENKYAANKENAIDLNEDASVIERLAGEFYGEQIAREEITPPDIVMSAGVWDDLDFVEYVWDNYLEEIYYETDSIPAVITGNGLIVFGDDFERIKTLDPVTYDDNGNVIPLSERFDEGNADIRYSVDVGENFKRDKYFDRQMDRWEELPDAGYVTVGKIGTANPLHMVGVPDGKVYYDVSKIKKSMVDHSDHLTSDILKNIPALLDDPMVLVEYKPGQNTNTVNVYGNLYTDDGTPITVGIVVTNSQKGTMISKVRTVHARRDFANQITDESVLYLKDNKKEINAWFQALGNDVPLRGTQLGVIRSIDFNNSIADTSGDVKGDVRYSIDMSSLDEDSRKIVTNLKTKSMAAKYLTGEYASMTPERFKSVYNDSVANGSPDYASQYIAWVKPSAFLYATTTDTESRERIRSEAGELDVEKLRGNSDAMWLTVDKETGEIVGHEGRHRMAALDKAGVKEAAVLIRFVNADKKGAKPIGSMKLEGQTFTESDGGYTPRGTGFYLHDALPLSERFGNIASQLFCAPERDGNIRYSREVFTEEEKTQFKLEQQRKFVKRQYTTETAFGPAVAASPGQRRVFATEVAQGLPGVTIDMAERAIAPVWDIFEKPKDGAKDTVDSRVEQAYTAAQKAAEDLISRVTAKRVNPLYEQYAELRRRLRTTPIKNDVSVAEFGGQEEYAAWRKKNKGLLRISDSADAVGIDMLYSELCEVYPEFFPKEIENPADMLKRLSEVAVELKDTASMEKVDYDPMDGYREEAAVELADRIMLGFHDHASMTMASKRKLESDKAKAREADYKGVFLSFNKLLSEEEKRYKQREEEETQRHLAIRAEISRYYNSSINKLVKEVDRQNRRIDKLTQTLTGRDANLRWAAEKKRFGANLDKLYTMLTEPSRKKHVPENMKRGVAELLKEFEGTPINDRKTVDANLLDSIIQSVPDMEIANGKIRVEDPFVTSLRENLRIMNQIRETIEAERKNPETQQETLIRMETDYLNTANYILKKLNGYIMMENQIFIDGKIREADAFSEELISDLVGRKRYASGDASATFGGTLKNEGRKYADKVHYEAMNAGLFFEMIGETGEQLDHTFRKGQDRQAAHEAEFAAYMKRITGGKYNTMKAGGHGGERIKVTVEGKEIDVSKAQLMSLYLLWKRPAGRRHLEAQGAVFTDANGNEFDERTFVITQDIMDSLKKHLSEDDIRVADAMQKFLAHQCALWGNEASMQMYGYRMYEDSDYFPIRVAREAKVKNAPAWGTHIGDISLENASFTKHIDRNSTSAVVIGNVFDTVENHVKHMASYSAYAPICNDLQRVLSRAEVRGAITRGLGTGGLEYIDNFLKDVNDNKVLESKTSDTYAWMQFLGNMSKRAAVAFNISTAAKQPLSLLRVFNEMDPQYILEAMATSGLDARVYQYPEYKRLYTAMVENSGVAKMKMLGYSDAGFAKSLRQQWDDSYVNADGALRSVMTAGKVTRAVTKGYDMLSDFGMKGAAWADERTWVTIWKACELETAKKHRALSAEERLARTTERFGEIIGRTQVVDSLLDTAPFKERTLGTGLGAFMNEPVKQYADLVVAIDGMVNGRKGAGKKFAVVLTTTLANSLLLEPMVSAVFSGLRDEEDDSEQACRKFLKNYLGIDLTDTSEGVRAADIASSQFVDGLVGIIPVLGDVYSVIADAVSGYDNTRFETDGLQQVVQSVTALFSGGDSKTTAKKVSELFSAVGIVTGIPYRTLSRDIRALFRNFFYATDNHLAAWNMNKIYYNIESTSARTGKNFYDIMAHAYKEGDMEAYRQMRKEMAEIPMKTSFGVSQSTITENIEKRGGEIQVGSQLWYVDLQASFCLEDFNRSMAPEQMITEVYQKTGDKSVLPSPPSNSFTVDGNTVKIEDPAAQERFATEVGEFSYNILLDMERSDAYDALTDAQKQYAIEKAYDYARKRSRKKLYGNYDMNNNLFTDLYEKNASPAAVAKGILGMAKEKK